MLRDTSRKSPIQRSFQTLLFVPTAEAVFVFLEIHRAAKEGLHTAARQPEISSGVCPSPFLFGSRMQPLLGHRNNHTQPTHPRIAQALDRIEKTDPRQRGQNRSFLIRIQSPSPAMLKIIISGCVASLLLASCGSVEAVKSTTAKVKQFSFSDLRPSRIDVVEVREKDLKEMPLGKDRALAYEQKKSFWSFLPGNFKEPDLPAIEDTELDGGLLPPKPL
jgi:hypothetical protein